MALALVTLVAVLDYATGHEIAFSFFYVAPVLVATWAAGRRAGILFALLSSVSFVATDQLSDAPFSSVWIPFWNFGVRSGTLLTVAWLASMLKVALEHERLLARVDSMTGVPNARSFRDRLQLECARVRRNGPPLSIAYLDLDGFKAINDGYGHEAGDDLLSTMGSALRETVREVDMVGRLGGDEFALLFPQTDEAGAMAVVHRLRKRVESLSVGRSGQFGYSLGVATIRYPTPTPDEALSFADRLMYEAKRAGKNLDRAGTFTAPAQSSGAASSSSAASRSSDAHV